MPLNPRDVGHRVVVRWVVRGEVGPSGRPALTDTLGLLLAWDDHSVDVRKADDTVVRIARDDIVSGKPVPPRPTRRAARPVGP